MDINLDLTTIWAFVIAFAVLMYVVLDGFDLGIGILFPTFRRGEERSQAMNAIAPVWDGKETWLVLGGGGLLAAFPLAYALILPATYPAIIAMLLALIFRGVAFVSLARSRHEQFWDFAFFGGSLIAALAQGIVLGALLQGIAVEGRSYAGGWLDWLSPYSVLTGVGVVAGYALLGATFLAMKVTGRGRRSCIWSRSESRRRHFAADERGQPRDPISRAAILEPMVRLAEHPLREPGAAADRHPVLRALPEHQHAQALPAVPAFAWSLRPRHGRSGDQHVALRRSAERHHLGGSCA